MAKAAKPTRAGQVRTGREADRRAVVEQMRREQQQQERRKTLLLVGAALLVGALIIGAAAWQLLKQNQRNDEPLAEIGASSGDAGCQAVVTKVPKGADLSGSATNHVQPGTALTYGSAPPAFGQHWPNFLSLSEVRAFWDTSDRPEVERLVHSLEHGWTILWYDQTIGDDDAALDELRAIATKFPDNDPAAQKMMVAPWTSDDGEAFPGGAHVALTHWSVAGDTAVAQGQQGVWQYCDEVSGEAVKTFMADYPWDDTPEAGST